MELMDIILSVIVLLYGSLIVKSIFFTSDYDKCYSEMEYEGIAVFGLCDGIVGGDEHTEYLNYDCIDCPYFVHTVDKDKTNENNI